MVPGATDPASQASSSAATRAPWTSARPDFRSGAPPVAHSEAKTAARVEIIAILAPSPAAARPLLAPPAAAAMAVMSNNSHRRMPPRRLLRQDRPSRARGAPRRRQLRPAPSNTAAAPALAADPAFAAGGRLGAPRWRYVFRRRSLSGSMFSRATGGGGAPNSGRGAGTTWVAASVRGGELRGGLWGAGDPFSRHKGLQFRLYWICS